MKSQDTRVLAYLRSRGPLTQKKALDQMGVMRLGAVIFRLKKRFNIRSKPVKVKNRFGQTCSVAEYSLLGEGMLI